MLVQFGRGGIRTVGNERAYLELVYKIYCISHSKSRLSASPRFMGKKTNKQKKHSQFQLWIIRFLLVLLQNHIMLLTMYYSDTSNIYSVFTVVSTSFLSGRPTLEIIVTCLDDKPNSHTEYITKYETRFILCGFWILTSASGTVCLPPMLSFQITDLRKTKHRTIDWLGLEWALKIM